MFASGSVALEANLSNFLTFLPFCSSSWSSSRASLQLVPPLRVGAPRGTSLVPRLHAQPDLVFVSSNRAPLLRSAVCEVRSSEDHLSLGVRGSRLLQPFSVHLHNDVIVPFPCDVFFPARRPLSLPDLPRNRWCILDPSLSPPARPGGEPHRQSPSRHKPTPATDTAEAKEDTKATFESRSYATEKRTTTKTPPRKQRQPVVNAWF